jgi:hypothetical protein
MQPAAGAVPMSAKTQHFDAMHRMLVAAIVSTVWKACCLL